MLPNIDMLEDFVVNAYLYVVDSFWSSSMSGGRRTHDRDRGGEGRNGKDM